MLEQFAALLSVKRPLSLDFIISPKEKRKHQRSSNNALKQRVPNTCHFENHIQETLSVCKYMGWKKLQVLNTLLLIKIQLLLPLPLQVVYHHHLKTSSGHK